MLFVSSLSLHSQTQPKTKPAKPAGSVSGRVTIKGKGASGIAVALRRPEMNSSMDMLPQAVTDQDGNYRITNVSAGAYEVVPSTQVYVNAGNENSPRSSIVIGENEELENINFSMVKGGVITGRITDADGRPAIMESVRLMRMQAADSRTSQPNPTWYAAKTILTDDRGIYRGFGLMPGKYTVAIGRASGNSFNFPARVSYKEVFYPDATDSNKATVLEVSEGSEATNIDIALGRPMEVFTVTGRVVEGEKGQPVPNIRFTLQRLVGERPEFMAFCFTSAQGEFSADGLLPGKYVTYMLPDANSELRAENASFDVIDSDVSGVTIRLVRGSSISGVVVLESENKQAFEKLLKLQVQAYVQSPTPGPLVGSSSRATIGADGSFRLGGLGTGMASLQIAPTMDMNQMKGFVVSRVEREGIAQSPQGFEVKDGEQITGVRIVVSYGNATLRGVVNIENGPLPQGARLMVRLMKPGDVPLNTRPPNVDDRGHFIAEGIPPGSYEVAVYIVGGGVRKPPVKQQVVLQDGVITDLAINFDLGATPKP
jgi:Protocatechuate 3,4-dioxygenase beta subunit